MGWFWTALMGAGMLIGSLLALAIAATRVVLPYDEAFVGMTRDELAAVNPRLLAFMAHDRVSLAGTMVAIGVLYLGLSLFGVRRGLHWARQSVFLSAFAGFAQLLPLPRLRLLRPVPRLRDRRSSSSSCCWACIAGSGRRPYRRRRTCAATGLAAGAVGAVDARRCTRSGCWSRGW